ncbi:PepSY domain-containing protein [Reyranella sp. CPCC 100927]|uniref:PepSY-associated TM helix domain-containing protein n=1 Tax=Reyranella sp. CPCC 100927 TaxID=2599616 RepID=UPI0011B66565|nr:PepSY domain-containing protein [Reyranella sp. CPCC 100927]TWT14796.1 PepSY domain-containing protein [Reyranella sp. CPCC 100927]
MSPGAIRKWSWVHKWSSLVCTAFLLLLCITGLPLIFHEEIEHLLGDKPEPPAMAADTPKASLDRVIAAGLERRPGQVVQFLVWDPDEPNVVILSIAKTLVEPFDKGHVMIFDARTAALLMEPGSRLGFMDIMLSLHVDMFAGLPGKLFLGLMGILFVVAIVSGVVLYAPFMRKLPFGTVRREKTSRTRWLDLHNLLGVVTVGWVLVVGGTGVINTWADLLIQLWRFDQLGDMVKPYAGQPPVDKPGSLDKAMVTAQGAAPGMQPSFVAFPGTLFSSGHHYMVAMRGEEALTKRLIQPVLVDARTAGLTDTRKMPWYITALLVSQPLHFGDYGGLPLKIVWALLDIVSIVVLGSGLYLWIARRGVSIDVRLATLTQDDGVVRAER